MNNSKGLGSLIDHQDVLDNFFQDSVSGFPGKEVERVQNLSFGFKVDDAVSQYKTAVRILNRRRSVMDRMNDKERVLAMMSDVDRKRRQNLA